MDLPSLSHMLDIPKNSSLVYLENKLLWELFLDLNVRSRVKLRRTTNENSSKVKSFVKVSDSKLLVYSETLSIRVIDRESEGSDTLGYLCPYCLKLFNHCSTLCRDHFECHIGPVSCGICQVYLPKKVI